MLSTFNFKGKISTSLGIMTSFGLSWQNLWKSRIEKGNSTNFSDLNSALTDGDLKTELKKLIIIHLDELKKEFIKYFSKINQKRKI